MPEKSRATLPREVTDHRERTELTETGPSDPQRFAERSIHFMVRTLPTLTPSSPRGGLPLRSSCFGIASAPPGPSLHVKGPSGSSNASRDGRHSEMETSGSSILDGGE